MIYIFEEKVLIIEYLECECDHNLHILHITCISKSVLKRPGILTFSLTSWLAGAAVLFDMTDKKREDTPLEGPAGP